MLRLGSGVVVRLVAWLRSYLRDSDGRLASGRLALRLKPRRDDIQGVPNRRDVGEFYRKDYLGTMVSIR